MAKKTLAVRDYLINVLNGMAWGLFSSLIIGLMLKQIGELSDLPLLITLGRTAQCLTGPAIGVGVAYVLRAPALVTMSAATVGAVGAGSFILGEVIRVNIGEPVGACVATLIGVTCASWLAGKSKLDIILLPLTTIITGGLAGIYLAPYFSAAFKGLGAIINTATEWQPMPMGIALAVIMGMLLTLPVSSAALAISLNLSGLAAGAATVGCCANMIGFAVISFRSNGIDGFIAQGLGTSMLQIPNIIKNPLIWLPSIVASAILGPVSTVLLKMESNATGAGMGTSGLVGQFAMLETMGYDSTVLLQIAVMHFLAPGIISFLVYSFLKRLGKVKAGDLSLKTLHRG